MSKNIKYSIVLPTLNGIEYLPTCVETIISQNYTDYELLISNNCSDDGTSEYLETLKANPQVKVIQPETRLTLGEHWDFAVSHAQGEWVYGIGSDDGVMPYFFKLLDKLIDIAAKKNINIIKSNRAYYFWENKDVIETYGNSFIGYNATAEIRILSCKGILKEVLYRNGSKCFDIPQMYTTSIFHRSVLEKARRNQTSKIIQNNITQDIYLGLLGCLCEDKYLHCSIPIGWVGTSSGQSHGLIFDEHASLDDFKKLLNEHDKFNEYYNDFMYHYTSYTLGAFQLYLASAIRIFTKFNYTDITLPDEFDLNKQENLTAVFYAVYNFILGMDEDNRKRRLMFFWDLVSYYKIDQKTFIAGFNKQHYERPFQNVFKIFNKCIRKIKRLTNVLPTNFSIYQNFNDANRFLNMQDVNKFIYSNTDINKMLESI